jgi:hypothetical protein
LRRRPAHSKQRELHVWAWKENPTGTFVNWHANVSCDNFTGQ